MRSLTQAIEAGTVVLDGGLGTLLESRGLDLTSSLWSARLLVDDPGAIRSAHLEYFQAGARVAITASYQVSYEGLESAGFDRSGVDQLLSRSVSLAREARAEAGLSSDEAWVAASVGPYGATRGDGSEYTGDDGLTVAQLRAWHRPRLEVLAAASPDALAVETLPSLREVEAVCSELTLLEIPAWVSVTVADRRLREGSALDEAFAIASDVATVVAIGVNCCDVAEVSDAIAVAARAGSAAVVYPNSGETWDAASRGWSGRSSALAAHTPGWSAAGARLVGGCCRVGPAEIREIADRLAGGGIPNP